MHRKRLGEILLERGIVTDLQLQKALEIQNGQPDVPLGRILVEQGFITNEDLIDALSVQFDCPSVFLDDVNFDQLYQTARKLPESICRRFKCIAFQEDDEFIHIAIADPTDLDARDRIERITSLQPKYYIAIEDDIDRMIGQIYGGRIQTEGLISDDGSTTLDVREEEELVDSVPVSRFIKEMFNRAIESDTTDIHIEPREDRTVIRFRIDGVLQTIAEINESPKRGTSHGAIVSKIKLLSELDIAQRLIPQDGRLKYSASGKIVDMRVSTLPSIHGEKIVIRLLDQSKGIVSLPNLGFKKYDLEKIDKLIHQPFGLIIVCGPTGSGKTTTLYSFLNEINSPEINIVSLEDPVEYHLDGITQVQVQERREERASLTFAKGLRSVLRQDPDVVLVGETRDAETASLSIQASLTGHLVFTTLHTNDSTGAISRLVNMGIEPFLLSSALSGVIAQRLMRRICPRCRIAENPTDHERSILGLSPDEDVQIYRGKGCATCNNTGYKGRIGVFEILLVDNNLRRMIAKGDDDKTIRDYAFNELGLITLSEAGKQLVKEGITTTSELLRTVYSIQ